VCQFDGNVVGAVAALKKRADDTRKHDSGVGKVRYECSQYPLHLGMHLVPLSPAAALDNADFFYTRFEVGCLLSRKILDWCAKVWDWLYCRHG
jgi:hypothetical protein